MEPQMNDDKEFSVCQFFDDDSYEYTRRYVSLNEAIRAFVQYTNNVAVKLGIVERIIITDGGDCVVLEWKRGMGYTNDGVSWRERP
jgi:uncharacterized SAM-dependent methyltransferase